MVAYYNEIDPNAAEWLRQLIKMGAIAPGDVDERSIVDVPSDDLRPYTQHHFFAGVGVWSYALRQAGWEDDRPIVTGSCPCQPYSAAGKRKGANDERDLWWAMFWHCCQLQPQTIIGEQVASKDGLAWWDVVQSDLENENYAATAFDLCAAGVGAPHIRQRLFWVAHSTTKRREREQNQQPSRIRSEMAAKGECRIESSDSGTSSLCKPSSVAHTQGTRRGIRNPNDIGATCGEINASSDDRQAFSVAHSDNTRLEGRIGVPECGTKQLTRAGSVDSFWSDAEWLPCSDGKSRAAKPGTFPLVNGLASNLVHGSDLGIQTEATAEARTMRLKGYGNAIVAPLAVEFIKAVMEVIDA